MGSIASTFPNGLRVKQIVGSLTIADQHRVLLADQPGAGKTAQALVGLEMTGLFERETHTLIMCNTTGCQLTWSQELKHRVATQYDVVIADLTDTEGRKTAPSTRMRNELLGRKIIEAADLGLPLIVLANFESIRWKAGKTAAVPNMFALALDAIVIDEGHLVLPTMEDGANKLTQFWYGLTKLDISSHAIRLDMTGTPDRGKLWNRYGHWKFLYPEAHKSFWAWARLNFVVSPAQWGGAEIGKLRNPTAWAAYDRQHMIRRTKAEMLEGLPEKQWAGEGGIDLPMTPLQEDAYIDYQNKLSDKEKALFAEAKIHREGGNERKAREIENQASALKLQFALRSRQMATCTWTLKENETGSVHAVPIVAGPDSSNKLAWVLDWLDTRGYTPDGWDPTQGKVVIVSYFAEVLFWLEAELKAAGIHSRVMSGVTPGTMKQEIEAQFQRGDLRIVLLSGYLGVSINLDAADDMIFLDPVHDPDLMEQVEDRIHRASRNHQCTYWRLASMDTADMVVLQTVDSRYRETRKSYEGSRGVQFARRMLGLEQIESAA